MPTFPGKLAPDVPELKRRVRRQMRGNPRRMGKKLFLAIPHPRRERARTQGIMTKTGDTLVEEQRSARALCRCLTWP